MKKTLFFIAAIIWTACSSDHVQEGNLQDKGRILIIEATKGQADTRGLHEDNNTLSAIWSEGDVVSVLSKGSYIGTLEPTTYGSSTTTLKSTEGISVSVGDNLTLIFPGIKRNDDERMDESRDYTGQIGTLDNIAKYYDYATASVTVQNDNGSSASTSEAIFENKQAIVKFTLKDDKGNDIEASKLVIDYRLPQTESTTEEATTRERIIITPTAATNVIYAALSGVNNKIVSLAANTYYYTTPDSKTFTNGKFYSITVKMYEPLTLECFDEECISTSCHVWVSDYGDLEYDLNGENNWAAYERRIPLKKDQWVSFRGTNATAGSISGGSGRMNIECSGNCYVYGNVMSLLDKNNYATKTDLPYNNTFQDLFMRNEKIFHDDGKDLVLPATKLVPFCYYQMFKGCINLSHIKCLATDISATSCTTNWLQGVARKGTFVKAEGFDGWTLNSDSGIPQGWTVTEE